MLSYQHFRTLLLRVPSITLTLHVRMTAMLLLLITANKVLRVQYETVMASSGITFVQVLHTSHTPNCLP